MDLDGLMFVDLGSDVLVRVDQIQAVVPRREQSRLSRVLVAGRWIDCEKSAQAVRDRIAQVLDED
jgi:hypothetical protein